MKNTLSYFALLALASPLFAQQLPLPQRDLATDTTRGDRPSQFTEEEEGELPELYSGELEDVGPTYLLLAEQARKIMRFYADFQSYFTTNVLLDEQPEQSANVSVTTLQLEAWPWETSYAGGDVQLRFGIRHQWYHFGLFGGENDNTLPAVLGVNSLVDDLDFNSLTGFGEARYLRGPWFGAAGFEYTRITDGNTGNETYNEAVPYLRVGYAYGLSDVSEIYGEFETNFRASSTKNGFDADANDRHEQALNLVYSHLFVDQVLAQLSYRLQYSGYTNNNTNEGRDDLYNTVAISASYYPAEWVSLRAYTSYQRRDSDLNNSSYEVGNFGGGLSLDLRF